MLAGYYGTTVTLDTSDETGALKAGELLEGAETVAVKKGIGAYAGLCLHPGKCREFIYQGAQKALIRIEALKPLRIEGAATVGGLARAGNNCALARKGFS